MHLSKIDLCSQPTTGVILATMLKMMQNDVFFLTRFALAPEISHCKF